MLISVRSSCPFLIVLCLSRICLFRCPSVLNMVVVWQSLHGFSPIVVFVVWQLCEGCVCDLV